MILVTGANGKTGKAILRELNRGGCAARAWVHKPEQIPASLESGAKEAHAGDFLNPEDLRRAFHQVDAVYHICPNMSEQEIEIGQAVIEAAKSEGIHHFVYHSVFHPQTEIMPHHWKKLRVEEKLFTSGLPYTILQPCAYMQNVMGYWDAILKDGVYALPYAPATRISMVDLEDIAQAAVKVLTHSDYMNAAYELVGPQALSQDEVADLIGRQLGRKVIARALDRAKWEKQARASGMPDYSVRTLLSMFEYYEKYGFTGNPGVLSWLLERPAHCLADFLKNLTT